MNEHALEPMKWVSIELTLIMCPTTTQSSLHINSTRGRSNAKDDAHVLYPWLAMYCSHKSLIIERIYEGSYKDIRNLKHKSGVLPLCFYGPYFIWIVERTNVFLWSLEPTFLLNQAMTLFRQYNLKHTPCICLMRCIRELQTCRPCIWIPKYHHCTENNLYQSGLILN